MSSSVALRSALNERGWTSRKSKGGVRSGYARISDQTVFPADPYVYRHHAGGLCRAAAATGGSGRRVARPGVRRGDRRTYTGGVGPGPADRLSIRQIAVAYLAGRLGAVDDVPQNCVRRG